MSRFVVVSLVGFGFAFYELSGGANFEPPVRPAPAASAEIIATITPEEPRQDNRIAASPLVQQAVLTESVTQEQTALTPPSQPSVLEVAAVRAEDQTSLRVSTEGLQLASLESGLNALIESPVVSEPTSPLQENAAEPEKDIRAVRASRVNMRQGPNTNYPIVARLLAGDKVEILQDEGQGWALLRVEKSGNVGWIATSLLSPKGS